MKFYYKIIFFIIFVLPFAFFISACTDDDLKTFTGISFSNEIVDYNGQEYEITILGELPDGVSVVYENNKATNAGEYNAKVTISMEGYKTLILTAKLIINKLNYDMSNVYWNYNINNEFTYNGNEHSVEVLGLPEGVSVKQYLNNKKINAGNYTASVEFECDTINYNKPVFQTLNWKIKKANYDMSNAKWTYKSPFVYDGSEKEVFIEGLPQGVSVKQYQNNKNINVGTYIASASFIYDEINYNEVTIDNCTWKIIPNVSNIAMNILNNIMNIPNPWEFLPESFHIENKISNLNQKLDFSNFVNVSSIPINAMGKQMNVVYSTLIDVDNALNCLRYVYGSFNIIVDFYQIFINDNPDNYAVFEKTTENFTFKIVLEDNNYQMYISYKSIAIELSYTLDTQKCYGRIQLTNSNVIKYEMAENEFTVAVNIVGISLTKLSFERENNEISGYLYEYFGTKDTNIKTSGLIKINENYTSIISNKLHSEDNVLTTGDVEIYSNETGNLIGEEVRGTNSLKDFQTSWFNLYNVTNINNLKVLDENNGLNGYSVFINNSTNKIKETRTLLGTGSRMFYITMRTMYVFTYNEEEENYKKVEILLPMLAVQNDYINTFSADFYEANKNNGAINPTNITLNNADKTFMFSQYSNLIDEYLVIKEQITYESIINYIGNKN